MSSTLVASALTGMEAAPVRAQLAPIAPPLPALAEPASVAAPPAFGAAPLLLEVSIDGQATHLVEPFRLGPGHRLSARPTTLEEIGIKVPGFPDPHADVDISSSTGVAYVCDEARQTVDFKPSPAQRSTRVYDARGERSAPPPAGADWGSVVNYSVYGVASGALGNLPRFGGADLSVDARVFGPVGSVEQTAIVGANVGAPVEALRLDTDYAFSDPGRMMTARAGDLIAGGLPWTRPIRMGGLQLQRDFALRGDLVTRPLPNLSGSAAVPSTVDVFVNGLKAFSQQVPAGPFSVTNLPVVSGAGTATMVVTDVTGRQTQSTLPLFSAPNLLSEGLTDFSVEAGFSRRNYGLLSNDYDKDPLASATLRRGVADWLTVEAHGEGGAGLVNGSLGSTVGAGRFGGATIAVAGSRRPDAAGAQLYADYNVALWGLTFDASTQRAFASFGDLASATATRVAASGLAAPVIAVAGIAFEARPPRAVDRLTIGMPVEFAATSLSASVVNLERADGTRSRLVTASLSRPTPFNGSLFVTAYTDLAHRSGSGLFAGLNVPLGSTAQASAGGTLADGSRFASVDVTRPLPAADNSVGWRVHDVEGSTPNRSGDLAYRSPYGLVDVQVTEQSRQLGLRGELDGSVGILSSAGLFVGNTVHNGFAVVDAGAADVPVYEDNRLVGTTGPLGKLVLPDLGAYGSNVVGIDPLALPANAEARSTRTPVSVAGRSGVGVEFGIDRKVDAALVTFLGADGKPLPPGLRGHLGGGSESFTLGYDGLAYVKHLAAENRAVIDLGDRDCTATFPFAAPAGRRASSGPLICR